MSSVVEQLQLAKNYILEHGWTQGNYRNNSGQVCILGALYHANWGGVIQARLGKNSNSLAVEHLLVRMLSSKPEKINLFPITDFNDDDFTTESDVYDLFDRAILLAKEEEAGATS